MRKRVVPSIFFLLFVSVWLLPSGDVATAGIYCDSAHGNADPPPEYGVNRSGTGYDIGKCTHCHDTFDEAICGVNPFMLFSTPLYTQQNASFCFECHKLPSNSVQVGMPNQLSYAYKFGGDTDTCQGHIKQAFNFIRENGNSRPDICGSGDGSAHHLTSIRDFLQGRWGFGDVLADINPCEGCHNPHRAQQHDYPVGKSPCPAPMTVIGMYMVQKPVRGWTVMPVLTPIRRLTITITRGGTNLRETIPMMGPTCRIM